MFTLQLRIKSDDTKHSFSEEPYRVFDQFPKNPWIFY